jgi:hypothetical protein
MHAVMEMLTVICIGGTRNISLTNLFVTNYMQSFKVQPAFE